MQGRTRKTKKTTKATRTTRRTKTTSTTMLLLTTRCGNRETEVLGLLNSRKAEEPRNRVEEGGSSVSTPTAMRIITTMTRRQIIHSSQPPARRSANPSASSGVNVRANLAKVRGGGQLRGGAGNTIY